MLRVGGAAETLEQGLEKMRRVLSDGSAFEKFRQLVELQGGDVEVILHPAKFRRAEHQWPVRASAFGYVEAINSEMVGVASMLLGAGRERLDSPIDHAAGIVLKKHIGDRVDEGEPLCVLEYNDGARVDAAVQQIEQAYRIGERQPERAKLIKASMTK